LVFILFTIHQNQSHKLEGTEIVKQGKKISTNNFFTEGKNWTETGSRLCGVSDCPFGNLFCASFILPQNLPPSCLHKGLGLETFYKVKIEGEVKESTQGKKLIAAHKEMFEDNLVLVTRAPETIDQPSKIHTKAGQMGRSVVESSPGSVPLNIEFSVDKNAYAFGERILLNLYIDNDSEEEVTGATFSLLQLWIIESAGKHEMNVIQQQKVTSGLPLAPRKIFKDTIEFQLPECRVEIPPTVRGATLFRVEFTLQAELTFQNQKALSPLARVPLTFYSLSNATRLNGEDWNSLYNCSGELQKPKGFFHFMRTKFSR